jgi:hypothetical protein
MMDYTALTGLFLFEKNRSKKKKEKGGVEQPAAEKCLLCCRAKALLEE